MIRGSLADANSRHRLWALGLTGLIVVASVLLGVQELGRAWTVGLQVATAVAGAALGNFLRLDFSESVVRNQARPAARHLFDQVERLRRLVQRAESYEVEVRATAADSERTADWFGFLGTALRDEINATAASIEHWGDLAPDVRNEELVSYQERESRLPRDAGAQGGRP
jgi:hypothetical protein